jgi:hypothetical protein
MGWMYKIHLYGRYFDSEHHQRFVDKTPFEVPAFDLRDKECIRRLVRSRHVDAYDCDDVQVFFYGQRYVE